MPTYSQHVATATAVLPAVVVPAYELVPGYTTQVPGSNAYHEEWPIPDANATRGWGSPSNSTARVVEQPNFGKNSLGIYLDRNALGQTATATKTLTNLVVGRTYDITMDYTYGGARGGRYASITTPARTEGGFLPTNPDGSFRDIVRFMATSTTQTFTVSVTGIPNDSSALFLRGAFILRFDVTQLGSSFYTPPVMQAQQTIPGRTVPLDLIDTTVTLDDGWSPYAKATLVCYAPSIEVLEALDPRKGLRVKVVLEQRWGDDSGNWNNFGYRAPVTRTFDLSLRERAVDKQAGTMALTLASDEALLLDYALVATAPDQTPLSLQASLRSVVNYVLAKVGATLTGGADTHVTVSQSPNPIKNPSGRRGLATYTAGGGTLGQDAGYGTYVISSTAGGAGTKSLVFSDLVVGTDLEPNTQYTLSLETSIAGQSVAPIVYASGTGVVGNVKFVVGFTDTAWHRLSLTFTTTAAGAVQFVFFNNDSVSAAAYIMYFRDAQVERGPVATPYFDGAKAPDAKYTYSWQGAADASASVRTLVLPRSEQLLDWMPGTSAWDFLEPIVQATGYSLWCDENRIWHLAKAWNTQTQINISPDTGLTAGVDQISRNENWYDSVVIEYRWTDRAGRRQVQWDIAGVPGNSTYRLAYDDTPYPGAGAAASVLRRADGKGRVISPESINNYAATPGMVLVVSLPDAPVQSGMLSNVTWNLPSDRMQVGSRALSDTPSDAWLNAVGSWTAAVGTWAAATGTT
jgi:hypothetical protein